MGGVLSNMTGRVTRFTATFHRHVLSNKEWWRQERSGFDTVYRYILCLDSTLQMTCSI